MQGLRFLAAINIALAVESVDWLSQDLPTLGCVVSATAIIVAVVCLVISFRLSTDRRVALTVHALLQSVLIVFAFTQVDFTLALWRWSEARETAG